MPVAGLILVWVVDLRRDVGVNVEQIQSSRSALSDEVRERQKLEDRVNTLQGNPPQWLLERVSRIESELKEIKEELRKKGGG